ncbi:hypothetical protein [Brevibacillus migulae]|uniref:hypothetical protein n=1 Tax=Brevibacillus migulae TaxID=1644114 RepID=UPI00106E1593|nr:hypothetical protein [Brevibacillus migulae]
MRFQLTPPVAEFYKKALELKNGEAIRLFVRAGEGFFLGVEKDVRGVEDYCLTCDEVTFFIKQDDAWFYDGKSLSIQQMNDEIRLNLV